MLKTAFDFITIAEASRAASRRACPVGSPRFGLIGLALLLRHGTIFVRWLARRDIEDGIAQECLRRPGRRSTAEILVEPFEMSRVVVRHFVPARPVSRVRVNDQPRRNLRCAPRTSSSWIRRRTSPSRPCGCDQRTEALRSDVVTVKARVRASGESSRSPSPFTR